jgi:hypothetical protein
MDSECRIFQEEKNICFSKDGKILFFLNNVILLDIKNQVSML